MSLLCLLALMAKQARPLEKLPPFLDFRVMISFVLRDHPFKTSACSRGGGVKNLPNLPMDSTIKVKSADGRGVGVKNE